MHYMPPKNFGNVTAQEAHHGYTLTPIVIEPESVQLQVHTPHEETIECVEPMEPEALEVVIDLGDIPGLLGNLDPHKENELNLEVSDSDSKDQEEKDKNDVDVNDLKAKKFERWDWSSRGAEGFVAWVKERFETVPSHSGYDSAGLERAVSYLEKLDNEISKAMRMDLDGELDSDKVEDIRSKIEDGVERLHERLDKIKKKKKKKKAEFESEALVKEGQRAAGVSGIYITVPLLISRIARVCINGSVSAGHSIEEIFKDQSKKYKLNDREQAEVMQLLADMNYPLRQDRGYMPDEDVDTRSSDNYDWVSNTKG